MNAIISKDTSKTYDGLTLTQAIELLEQSKKWTGVFSINKYDFSHLTPSEREIAERDHSTLSPMAMQEKWGNCFIEDKEVGENLLLNEGINEMLLLITGSGGQAYNNATARLGVGDSTTAAAATQTALQAATNLLFKAMDATYPTVSGQTMTFRATFGSAEANFGWQEFSIDNGNTANKNMNRLVSNQGTKTSGQSWQLTLTVTLS